jgi:hypothetical protein
MNVDADRFDQDVVQKVLEPFGEILAREDQELKKVDEAIREAECKCRHLFHLEQ